MRLRTAPWLIAILLVSACSSAESPLGEDSIDVEYPNPIAGLNANGTVVWLGIEGGLWAIRMDGGALLDPHETLPASFRVNNLRVQVEARVMDNVPCFHMVGPRVSITRIARN